MVQYPSNGGGYRDLPSDAPPPRLCLIQKQEASQEYGFNLHAEKKGQFIGAVDSGSPADYAGLKQGDRIFAVNGNSIVGIPHKTVVSWIKSDPLKCEMLVVSEDDYQWYTENQIPVDMSLPNIIRVCKEFYDIASVSSPSVSEKSRRHTVRIVKSYEATVAQSLYCTSIEVRPPGSLDSTSPSMTSSYSESTQSSMRSTPEQEFDKKKRQLSGSRSVVGGTGSKMQPPPPRLCRLQKLSPSDEFGFNLHAERGKGHFIGAVDLGGIGDKAGLVMGQRIVGVNDKLIYPDTPHKEVVALIKKDPLCTELLVVSEEVDRWYTENNAAFSFKNAIRYNADPVILPRASLGDSKRDGLDSRTMEKQTIQPEKLELVESEPVDRNAYETLERTSELDNNNIKQTTTLSTTQVTDPYIPEEDPKVTDDIIDQIFKDVPLAPVKGLDNFEDDHSTSTLTRNTELDHLPPYPTQATTKQPHHRSSSSSSGSETRPLTSVHREPSPKPVPLVTPPVSNTRAQVPFDSSRPASRALDSRTNGNTKNADIFNMNAKEAQRAMYRQKKDPRKEQLTIEQKHRLIADL